MRKPSIIASILAAPGASRIGHVDGLVEIIAIALVERFNGLDQIDSLVLIHLRHLAYEHGGADGILVTHIGTGHIAVRLLKNQT